MNASIARRYARALLEVASAEGAADAAADQLGRLAAAVTGSTELRGVLANPAFDRAQRHAVVAQVAGALGLGATVLAFAQLLVDRARAGDIPEIAERYRELADEHAGRALASIATAAPLPPDLRPALERALSGAVARTVTLRTEVDPNLLGGAVAQVGSLRFDGSLRTQLDSLRKQLKG